MSDARRSQLMRQLKLYVGVFVSILVGSQVIGWIGLHYFWKGKIDFSPLFEAIVRGPHAPPDSRLAFSIRPVDRAGRLELRVNNRGASVSLSAESYLTLTSLPAGDDPASAYWASLDLPGGPTTTRPLNLARGVSQVVEISAASESWAADRIGSAGPRPLGMVVGPGSYFLQFQVVDTEQRWWRSNSLEVNITEKGDLVVPAQLAIGG